MAKASPELVAGLVRAVQNHFPEPDLMTALVVPGAIDDVSEVWISSLIELFELLPEQQRSVLRSYETTGRKLKEQGRTELPTDNERAALLESLRKALAAYHAPRDAAETLLNSDELRVYTTAELRDLTESIEKLREHQRRLLQTLLDMDERAEARARKRALDETDMNLRREDMFGAPGVPSSRSPSSS